MVYFIAIPSYKRSMVLLHRTLNFLERNSIDPKLIYIFIVEEDKNDYMEIPIYLYKELVIGVKGIAQQREFIENYFKEGDHIVMIDDDIQDILYGDPNEEVPLDELINNNFELCKKEDAYIWGLYPVGNPFFTKNNRWYSTHLTFICGALFGIINRPTNQDLKYVFTYDNGNLEDFERSIRYWYHDKKVIRLNKVCIKTKYFGKDGGGLGNLEDRIVQFELNAKLLHAHYPTITRLRFKKSGYTDIALNDHSGQTLRHKKQKNISDH